MLILFTCLQLLTLLAISIAMLTLLIEMFLSRGGAGSKAAAAGACVLVIMQVPWLHNHNKGTIPD